MAKFRAQKSSFIAGQISPTAQGRVDLPPYQHACKTLKNAIPLLAGGAYRRPGTYFETRYAAASYFVPALIPFKVSRDETYMLWLLKAVGASGTIEGRRITSNTAAGSAITCSGTHPYLAGRAGGVPPGLFPGRYDEWHDVQYVQSVDIMTLVHPNYKPRRVTRSAVDTFAITEFDAALTGEARKNAWPYLPINVTAAVITPSGTSGSVTLTASSVPGGTTVFTSTMIGAVIKIKEGSTVGAAVITAYTSATIVTATVIVDFASTGGQTTWWESAWSDRRGWPRAVDFHLGRMVYGGTLYQPDTLWFTETNDYNQLSVSAALDPSAPGSSVDAFTLTPALQETNQIQWIASEKTLLVGTSGDELIIEPAYDTNTVGFGSTNVQVRKQSSLGSAYRQARRAGRELFFITKPEDEARSLVFNETEQTYADEPLQILFDDYPRVEPFGGARKYRTFAWDRSRKTMWACDTAGNLFGMTRDRSLQITAWHTHEMGGFDTSKIGQGTTISMGVTTSDPAYFAYSGTVHSVACLPNPLNGMDDLWMVVARKINGAFSYHIERMIGGVHPYETAYSQPAVGVGNYFVDAAIYGQNDWPGSEDFQFSGLGHLEGEVVRGTSFNTWGLFALTGSAVASGVTTLASPRPTGIATEATICTLGLPFTTDIIPVRPEAGSQIGTAQGAIKRVHEVVVRFYKTLSAKVGALVDGSAVVETMVFRTGSLAMGKSPELYSAEKRCKPRMDYDRDSYVLMRQDEPLPFAVVSLSMEGMTADG